MAATSFSYASVAPLPLSSMLTAPECIVETSLHGRRHRVDVKATKMTDSELTPAKAVELRRFHLEKHLPPDTLRRLVVAHELQSLLLEDCVLCDRSVALITERLALPAHHNRMVSLIFRRCKQLSMTSLMGVASFLNGATIHTLELSSCQLARQAGILLGQTLQSCRVLKRVNLSNNNLRDGGLKAIADGLRQAKATAPAATVEEDGLLLDVLDVSSNGLSSVGVAMLAQLPVKRLELADNGITYIQATLFTSNLELQHLNASRNPLTEEAIRELWWHTLHAPQLVGLEMENCGISMESEAFLLKSFTQFAKIAMKSSASSDGKRTNGSTWCSLRNLYVGEKEGEDDEEAEGGDEYEEDEEVEDKTTSGPEGGKRRCKRRRWRELKSCMEARVPGLVVHLLASAASPHKTDGRDATGAAAGVGGGGATMDYEDSDIDEQEALVQVEAETPGRQVRRALLERTEFMRRRSEELPDGEDDDGDESRTSFGGVSNKLLPLAKTTLSMAPLAVVLSAKSTQPHQQPQQQPPQSAIQGTRPALVASSGPSFYAAEADNDPLDELELDSPLTSSRRASSFAMQQPSSTNTSSFYHHHHSQYNSSQHFNYQKNNNHMTSLDDVASQFSIDPPPSVTGAPASLSSSSAAAAARNNALLQSNDVEFIVSRTIDTMNRNFEQRLTQFLMQMEYQQQEKNASQLQTLAAKMEACERAIPRLEARLDVLADRIATSGAQVAKMQTEWQAQAQAHAQAKQQPGSAVAALTASTPLTPAMQSQVDELIASRLRASDHHHNAELAMLRHDVAKASQANATVAAAAAGRGREACDTQSIVDAVSVHLTQFKHEFDANQSHVLRNFTENIVHDGLRVDERMLQIEGKVAHLEGIIQAEQHASLLALEAISEAFAANPTAGHPTASPLRPVAAAAAAASTMATSFSQPQQQQQPSKYTTIHGGNSRR